MHFVKATGDVEEKDGKSEASRSPVAGVTSPASMYSEEAVAEPTVNLLEL